jgi:hypothetical protein
MQKSSARAEGAVTKKHANVSAVAAEAANVFQVDFIFSSFFFCRPGGKSPAKDSPVHHCAEVHGGGFKRRVSFDNGSHPHCSNALTWLGLVIISSLEATEISLL